MSFAVPAHSQVQDTDASRRRELYSSPDGDQWFLARDPATGRVFVRHYANIRSGGRISDIDIGAFLGEGRLHPEHQALLRLIGTLVEALPMD
jgi:hypothetical protein